MISKKELLDMEEKKIKWDLSSIIFRIPSISYIITTHIQNIKGNKLLILNFYKRADIEAGKNYAVYKTFIMNDNYISVSLENNNSKWYTGSINKLKFLKTDISYNAYVFFSEKDERNVSKFFNKAYEKNTGFELITNYQEAIMKKRLKINHSIIKEKIDTKMKEIVSLPKNFNSWINDKVFDNRRYFFYKRIKKNDYNGFCSYCRNKVSLTYAKHNNAGICPLCCKEIIFKSIGLSNQINDSDYISFIQKTGNGIAIRYFYVDKSYIKDLYNPEVNYFETYRVFVDFNNSYINFDYYEYGNYKNTGEYRWCRRNTAKYCRYTCVYPYNLESAFKSTKLKYFNLSNFFENVKEIDIINCIIVFLKQPILEYFIKLKLYNVVKDIVYKDSFAIKINFEGKSIKQILGITKEHLLMLKQIKGDENCLFILQVLVENQIKFTVLQLKLIHKTIGKYYIKDFIYILKYTSIIKALNYLNKQKNNFKHYNNTGYITIWKDYINDCEMLNYNLQSSLILFPENLLETHNEMITLIDSKKIEKFDKIISERVNKLKGKYDFSYNNMQIIIPKNSSEIIKEGNDLSHCVGRINYLEKVASGEIDILFIRKENEITKSFYTVEIKDCKVMQCHGYKNKGPSKDVQEFLEKLVLFIKKGKLKDVI